MPKPPHLKTHSTSKELNKAQSDEKAKKLTHEKKNRMYTKNHSRNEKKARNEPIA